MFPLLRWTPYFISAKKTFIKNRLGKILDNLLRINMMSVGSSNSKNSPRKVGFQTILTLPWLPPPNQLMRYFDRRTRKNWLTLTHSRLKYLKSFFVSSSLKSRPLFIRYSFFGKFWFSSTPHQRYKLPPSTATDLCSPLAGFVRCLETTVIDGCDKSCK